MPRVASYNCQQSQKLALNFIANEAAKVGADATCTQESGTRMALNSYLADTPNFAAPDAYADDACVVVTTTSERVQKAEGIAIRAGANENRSALLVQLRTSGLVVVNVHLTSGNEKRSKAELAIIYEYLLKNYSKASWLIIGDFNHDPRAAYPKSKYCSRPATSKRILAGLGNE